jgi:hypothetical protein
MFSLNRVIIFSFLLCGYAFAVSSPVIAAMDPRFEIDPQTLGVPQAATKPPATKPPAPQKTAVKSDRSALHAPAEKTAASGAVRGGIYAVKSGDNLFKILMRDYGLNNDEAESFIEEICRENNIYDIKRLKIGQKIVIPAVRRKADGSLKVSTSARVSSVAPKNAGQMFRLESPVAPLTEEDATARVKQTWDAILPPPKGEQKPIYLQSPAFSLTLDPARYPVYAAMNGGKILIDQHSSIPPLVKSLITEKDPSLHIVTESPANGRRFLAALLESAGFYSVEENFSMDFGADPKITVHSDFKIEKSPDSLIKQDIVLINSGRVSYPAALGDFLKKEGFSVFEPFGTLRPSGFETQRQVFQIMSKSQPEIVDAILSSLSVTPVKDRRLDVFAADNNGISLSVKAERYFEQGGQRSVVTRFDGDPMTYTLFRILEAKGYQVVILEAQDDFRKVSDKLLSRMNFKKSYAQHKLNSDENSNYSLLMTGVRLEGNGLPAGGIILTNLEIDKIIRGLLTENGYTVTTK